MALAVWQSTIVNRSGDVQPNAQVEVRLESSGCGFRAGIDQLHWDRDKYLNYKDKGGFRA